MMTVREYALNPYRSWIVLGIPDGWKPICVRPGDSGEIILAALLDTDEPLDQEVFRLVRPGEDVWLRSERQDSAFLGYACGLYVFLDLPSQRAERRVAHPALVQESLQGIIRPPARRIGRPDISKSGENPQDQD